MLLCSFLWDQEELGQALEPGVVETGSALPAFCIQSGLKGVELAGHGVSVRERMATECYIQRVTFLCYPSLFPSSLVVQHSYCPCLVTAAGVG